MAAACAGVARGATVARELAGAHRKIDRAGVMEAGIRGIVSATIERRRALADAEKRGPHRTPHARPFEQRSMRGFPILSCRTAAYCGQSERCDATLRNNFLQKLKKPPEPALQGSAKRFDEL
nr:hypothetical protein [Burkholderia sp. MSMB1552]